MERTSRLWDSHLSRWKRPNGWTLVIVLELFVMLALSFHRLDDLTWGSSVGMDRLSNGFAGYNGRYVGNLIVIALTRLPAGVRAGLEVVVLCVLFYYAHRLLPKKGASCLFLLAFLCLPIPVLQQSVVWTSGFANYTTSAVVMLFIMDTYCRVVMRKERLSPAGYVILLTVSFFGQLILENTTLYVVTIAGCFLVYGLIKDRKVYVPVAGSLVAAACGAMLMFSNTSYKSALNGNGAGYKSILVRPLELFEKYQEQVIPHLVKNNHLLNLALTITLLLLWLTKKPTDKKRKLVWSDKFWSLWGVGLIAFFAYDTVENTWTQAFGWGQRVYGVISLLYAAYILVTICSAVSEKEGRPTLLLFALSQIILAAPLVPATPLSPRCFFQNGILWAMLLGSMLQILLERCHVNFGKERVITETIRVTQLLCVCYLAFMLCGQSLSWRVQALRQEITRDGIERGAETIVLPEVPYSGTYCYGANVSNSDDYWLTNYKRYYGIPMDIKLEFQDYYKWRAEHSGH